MPKTVPNQRVIRVHRERASSDFLGIKNERWMAASRILGATALRLYLYLASNSDNYLLALSPLALERDVGMPRSTFYDQFRKLVNCGYLVQTGGNQYDFYEVPQSGTQTNTADGQDNPTDKPKNPADDIEINIINNKYCAGTTSCPRIKRFCFLRRMNMKKMRPEEMTRCINEIMD
jgi:hypothetical protein